MENYDYPCSQDCHGLRYPGLSIVMMQVFTLDPVFRFEVGENLIKGGFVQELEEDPYTSEQTKVTKVEGKKCVDTMMFLMNNEDRKNFKTYSLGGFRFSLTLDDPYPVELSGLVNVRMSQRFGRTLVLSYRFLFDGKTCRMSEPISTDHIIAFLSTHLSSEYWNVDDEDRATMHLKISNFKIQEMMLDEDGNLLSCPLPEFTLDDTYKFEEDGKTEITIIDRPFSTVTQRYKAWVGKNCAQWRDDVTCWQKREYKSLLKYRKSKGIDYAFQDYNYAMVDIWESVMHPTEKDGDIFDNFRAKRMSEAEITRHISKYHKEELMGLMTMYHKEWPFRDAKDFEACCGENIAIDVDDLVLANSIMAVVIGLYGRRDGKVEAEKQASGKKEWKAVNWLDTISKTRSVYDVSWPEYLLIIEILVAKKHILRYAGNELMKATLGSGGMSPRKLIAKNADLSMRLSRMELQLDVMKYTKYMAHKVMHDRTAKRLEIEADTQRLHDMMQIVDNSLHNKSDEKAMKSDGTLNFILGIVSVASAAQLMFMDVELPFLMYKGYEISSARAKLVIGFATIAVISGLIYFTGKLLIYGYRELEYKRSMRK